MLFLLIFLLNSRSSEIYLLNQARQFSSYLSQRGGVHSCHKRFRGVQRWQGVSSCMRKGRRPLNWKFASQEKYGTHELLQKVDERVDRINTELEGLGKKIDKQQGKNYVKSLSSN